MCCAGPKGSGPPAAFDNNASGTVGQFHSSWIKVRSCRTPEQPKLTSARCPKVLTGTCLFAKASAPRFISRVTVVTASSATWYGVKAHQRGGCLAPCRHTERPRWGSDLPSARAKPTRGAAGWRRQSAIVVLPTVETRLHHHNSTRTIRSPSFSKSRPLTCTTDSVASPKKMAPSRSLSP